MWQRVHQARRRSAVPTTARNAAKAVRVLVLNSGSERTTAEAQKRARPVDVIIAHRNLPEHSSAEQDRTCL